MDNEVRTVKMVVLPVGESLFSERATQIEIIDEAAGEFVEVTQYDLGSIRIDADEWPMIREVIEKMIGWCRNVE